MIINKRLILPTTNANLTPKRKFSGLGLNIGVRLPVFNYSSLIFIDLIGSEPLRIDTFPTSLYFRFQSEKPLAPQY